MHILLWTVIALYLAALFLYLRMRDQLPPVVTLSVKVLASLLYVLIAVFAFAISSAETFYFLLLLSGLVLGVVGDVALGTRDVLPERADMGLLVGMCAYMLGHVFYIVLFTCFVPVGLAPLLGAAALFGIAYVLYRHAEINTGALFMPAMVYTAVVCILVAFACYMLIQDMRAQSWLLFAGAVLFAASDISAGYGLFVRGQRSALRIANACGHYAAQALFALSVLLS